MENDPLDHPVTHLLVMGDGPFGIPAEHEIRLAEGTTLRDVRALFEIAKTLPKEQRIRFGITP